MELYKTVIEKPESLVQDIHAEMGSEETSPENHLPLIKEVRVKQKETILEWANKYLPKTALPLFTSPSENNVIFIDQKTGKKFKVFKQGSFDKIAVEIENEKTGIKYELSVSNPDQTAIRIFNLKNLTSGVDVNFFEPNENIDVASLIAWIGSRTSREDKIYVEINGEIVGKNVDAGEKLGKVFADYKHDSPAGMAYIAFGIDNISIADAFALFYRLAVGDGQELSTRYVKFMLDKVLLDPTIVEALGEEYREEILAKMKDIQNLEADNYKNWVDELKNRYQFYIEKQYQEAKDRGENLDNVKLGEKVYDNRARDIGRAFIPLGAKTKFYLVASARMWRDLIISLRESEDLSQKSLAEDIATMFSISTREEVEPMAPQMVNEKLISHSEAKHIVDKSEEELRNYLNTIPDFVNLLQNTKRVEMMGSPTSVEYLELGKHAAAFNYIVNIYPYLDASTLLEFLKSLKKDQRRNIGNIIFSAYELDLAQMEVIYKKRKNVKEQEETDPGRFNKLSNGTDIRSHFSFKLRTGVIYGRDFGRHRVMGRDYPIFENGDIDVILDGGFNQNYQIHESAFLSDLSDAWDKSFEEIYTMLRELNNRLKELNIDKAIRKQIIMNLLPMGHQMDMYLTIPDGAIPYVFATRGAVGIPTADRDMGYVRITSLMTEALRENNDYFTDAFKNYTEQIDPNNFRHLAARGEDAPKKKKVVAVAEA